MVDQTLTLTSFDRVLLDMRASCDEFTVPSRRTRLQVPPGQQVLSRPASRLVGSARAVLPKHQSRNGRYQDLCRLETAQMYDKIGPKALIDTRT